MEFFRWFDVGVCLALFIFMIHLSFAVIYVNILNNYLRPQNDPGILIWWLCCLRLGQTGKYAPKKKKARKVKRTVRMKKLEEE